MANLGDRPYWQDIERAAKDVIENTDKGGDDTEELDSWAETFTIYTSDALHVLVNTNHDNAVLDIYGTSDLMSDIDSIEELYSRIAFFAVREDIAERIAELQAEQDS